MANLFSVTAPLLLVYPDGQKRLIAEKFFHPDGVLFFDLFWQTHGTPIAHLLTGEIRGEGPWKVGDTVVRILSCGDTAESMQWQTWQEYLASYDDTEPYESRLHELARQYGAIV